MTIRETEASVIPHLQISRRSFVGITSVAPSYAVEIVGAKWRSRFDVESRQEWASTTLEGLERWEAKHGLGLKDEA